MSDLLEAFQAPFDPSEIKWKPAVVSGERAMALAYVDARVIEDRLDNVLGVAGWQDEYQVLPDGSVMCRLKVRVDGEWITKEDVGSLSEQPDGGDRMKAAFSDALKRAAVKFGIGRYLYRLGSQWVDYDPKKKRFKQEPRLPADAIPRKAAKPAPGVHPSLFVAADHGLEALQAAWEKLTPDQRKSNQPYLEGLKERAAEVKTNAVA